LKVSGEADRGLPQTRLNSLGCLQDALRISRDGGQQQEIGLDGDDAKGIGGARREVCDVAGNEVIGGGMNGGRQDVSVVRVRQRQGFNQLFIASDKRIGRSRAHSCLQAAPSRIRQSQLCLQGSLGFSLDLCGPTNLYEARLGNLENEVPCRCVVQDIGIKQSEDPWHRTLPSSLIQAQVLADFGQLAAGFGPLNRFAVVVREHIPQVQAVLTPDPAGRELAGLDERHETLFRHAQQFRCQRQRHLSVQLLYQDPLATR